MTRERVALFLPELAGGGAEQVMLRVARALSQRGWSVDLVLGRAEGALMSDVPVGVQVAACGSGWAVRGRWRLAVSMVVGLARYLRRERPACVLSTLTGTNLAAVLGRRLARTRTRLVLKEVNTSHNVRSRLIRFLVRRLYTDADQVIAVSNGVAEDLVGRVGLEPERVRVIYNPIDIGQIARLASEDPGHAWLSAGTVPLIVSAGRLAQQKDFSTLIHAFALVRRDRPLRLLILGEGPRRRELERLIEELGIGEDVELPGFVANPMPYFKHAALFVLSSRWEGFGLVILEALAVGTAVVATDCHSGPADILDGGAYGILVPTASPDHLAAAIARALDEPCDPARLEGRARQFSLEHQIDKFIDALGLSRGDVKTSD